MAFYANHSNVISTVCPFGKPANPIFFQKSLLYSQEIALMAARARGEALEAQPAFRQRVRQAFAGSPLPAAPAELQFELARTCYFLGTQERPLPAADPLCRRPDIAKAIAVWRWQPELSRQEGIKRVILFFQAKLEALCRR